MNTADLSLIKIVNTHYFEYSSTKREKTSHRGRSFFDKYEKKDERLTSMIMQDHFKEKRRIAHNLINSRDKVENIVFNYNGRNTDKFWHRLQLLLREEGYLNFTAYNTKSNGHLHVYIHKGHTTYEEGCRLANELSMKMAQKMPKEWNMYPRSDIPREFNILDLPKSVYNKERGSSWAKHM